MIVCICGGRDKRISPSGYQRLNELIKDYKIEKIIHGGCPTGVDNDANEWAIKKNFSVQIFKADWSVGKRGGPERNRRMAKVLQENRGALIAFAGGRGTNNMKEECKKLSIPIVDLSEDEYVTN